ncbi:putative toxin-antitoxin system toxin component, PIN family [Candidatus Curtissbacteria bacterium]|nr:putative toxin-antitoxin system toxin component, PIN family [Candidatus Curtissbacteria bacterium]
MKVFLDASVIIASLLSPTGGSSRIFQYMQTDTIVGITSQTALDEILNAEKYKKLKKSRKEIKDFIAQSGLIVRERISASELSPYENLVNREDAHLIAGASLTRSEYLVTLDKKHLLKKDIRERFLPLKIVSPREVLEEIIKLYQ